MQGRVVPAPSRRQRVDARRSTSRAGAARHFMSRTFKSAADSANLTGCMAEPMSAMRGPSFCFTFNSHPTAPGTKPLSVSHSALQPCLRIRSNVWIPTNLPVSLLKRLISEGQHGFDCFLHAQYPCSREMQQVLCQDCSRSSSFQCQSNCHTPIPDDTITSEEFFALS